jgi:hypothetical protein
MRWVINATPRPLYPQGRPGTLCIRGMLHPRVGLDKWGKSRPPSGFDRRTVQPVACRKTDKLLQFRVQTEETVTYIRDKFRLSSGTSEQAEFNQGCQTKILKYKTLHYRPRQSNTIPLFPTLTAARFPLFKQRVLIYLAHIVGHFLRAALSNGTWLIQHSLHTNSRLSCNEYSCCLVCRRAVVLQSQLSRVCVCVCAVWCIPDTDPTRSVANSSTSSTPIRKSMTHFQARSKNCEKHVCPSVLPSVRMEQLGTLRENQYTFLIIFLSVIRRMKNISHTSCREN